jgi:phage shock protein PspC (stress-responsive transcriptional regulator)
MAQLLYKNKSNKVLFGVCSGLADVLGIDVTIVRILTILGTIVTGSLILWIYILLGLLLPNKNDISNS